MNTLIVRTYMNEEVAHEFRANYNPSDTKSINDCIDSIINQAEGVKEDVRNFNEFATKLGRETIRITKARFKFIRQDATVIDDIEINDVEASIEKLDFVQKFFIV